MNFRRLDFPLIKTKKGERRDMEKRSTRKKLKCSNTLDIRIFLLFSLGVN